MLNKISKATELKLRKLELEEALRLFPEPEGPEDESNLEYLGVDYERYVEFAAAIEGDYRVAAKLDRLAANQLLSLKVADLSAEEKAALMAYHKVRFQGISDPRAWAKSREGD